MAKAQLLDFLLPKPERIPTKPLSIRIRVEVDAMLKDLASEMETTQTNILSALIAREHDKLFEKE